MLSQADKETIVEAIAKAERLTSGEIRVHIDKKCSGDPLQRAIKVFEDLKMHETALRNGVLIYLSFSDKKVAILGDQGINERVPENFWDSSRSIMIYHFKNNDFARGIILAIKEAGEQLKAYFPIEEGDTNELSNEITLG